MEIFQTTGNPVYTPAEKPSKSREEPVFAEPAYKEITPEEYYSTRTDELKRIIEETGKCPVQRTIHLGANYNLKYCTIEKCPSDKRNGGIFNLNGDSPMPLCQLRYDQNK